jgi:hypothetical protein
MHVNVEIEGTSKSVTIPVTVEKTLTATFNNNGGSGVMAPVSCAITDPTKDSCDVVLPANTFTRANYAFNSWNTQADGKGTKYADKATVTLTADTTQLFAQWTASNPVLNTVTLKASGSTLKVDWTTSGAAFDKFNLTLTNSVVGIQTQANISGATKTYQFKGQLAGTYTVKVEGVKGSTKTSKTATAAIKLVAGKAVSFTDIGKLSAGSKDAINWMAKYGVTQGDGKGHYQPANNVTREQMALFLYRLAGLPETVGTIPVFTDIKKLSASSQTAINWLGSTGITVGDGKGHYQPAENVTREQMALFMFRFGLSPAKNGSDTIPNFTDLYTIDKNGNKVPLSVASKQAIKWLASYSITLGDGKGHYQPANKVTREQMALFMYRLAGKLKSY